MSGTEEVPGTRPTLTRCTSCMRPLESAAHENHRCTYCKARFRWIDKSLGERVYLTLLDYLPTAIWIVFGLIMLYYSGDK
jgi:tRNA(Ile2) C34 agmatinyltransferase TiaS